MAKSLIRQRREQGAVCPVCRSPDYEIAFDDPEWIKPRITCGQCGHWWCYGYDGGIYAELSEREESDEA